MQIAAQRVFLVRSGPSTLQVIANVRPLTVLISGNSLSFRLVQYNGNQSVQLITESRVKIPNTCDFVLSSGEVRVKTMTVRNHHKRAREEESERARTLESWKESMMNVQRPVFNQGSK